MIPRYSRPEMAKIWSDENKFQTWFEIEACACEALAKLGKIPQSAVDDIRAKGKFDPKRIDEIEAEVKHDVIAFLTNVGENVGENSLGEIKNLACGAVAFADKNHGLIIKTSSGGVRLACLQEEGGKKMEDKAFFLGHKIAAGTLLKSGK